MPEVSWHPTATRAQAQAAILGLQLSARSLPGTAAAADLGDFYDVHPIGPRRWGLAVGDIRPSTEEDDLSGERLDGLSPAVLYSVSARPAAGTISTACAVLRAMAFLEARPSKVLRGLNRAFLDSPARDQCLAVTYAAVRPTRTGTLVRICTAGEQVPYVRRACGSVFALGRPGTPLGLRRDPQLHDARVRLRAGDSLILVTENVTHAVSRADGTPFGASRLGQVLVGLGGASAARTVKVVLRAVREFCGGYVEHETAALVVKVPGSDQASLQRSVA